jgi:hypothetical protein
MSLKFLKYFLFGLLVFFLQTHGRTLPVDFFVLTLTLAFPVLSWGAALLLTFILALFYGAYSVTSWPAWFLPAAAALIVLRFWKELKDWPAVLQQAGTLSLFLLFQWVWAVVSQGWTRGMLREFFVVWVGTSLTVLLVLPGLQFLWKKFLEALPRPRRPMAELSLYRRPEKISRSPREIRRPFGLERG